MEVTVLTFTDSPNSFRSGIQIQTFNTRKYSLYLIIIIGGGHDQIRLSSTWHMREVPYSIACMPIVIAILTSLYDRLTFESNRSGTNNRRDYLRVLERCETFMSGGLEATSNATASDS